jgi:hypothetical protein
LVFADDLNRAFRYPRMTILTNFLGAKGGHRDSWKWLSARQSGQCVNRELRD